MDAETGAWSSLTYQELLGGAMCVARRLRALGLRRGDRVLISLPTSLELIETLYGVLLTGGICVPIFPASATPKASRWRARATTIARVVQPAGAIVTRSLRLHMRSVLALQAEGLFTTTPSALLSQDGEEDLPVTLRPEDLALIQFTSGTTTEPRGAAITHDALMANVDALVEGMSFDANDVSVSWLPSYHDMGLIGHLFTPVRCAIHQYLLSPQAFIRSPVRWLRLISEVRATQTTAPNAAYEICVRKVPPSERVGLDLSSLRWALNGAELVQAGTIERFCRAYEPQGFDPAAMRPVYGLAEATLAAALGPVGGVEVDEIDRQRFTIEQRSYASVGEEEAERIACVSVGRPITGHEIRIATEEGEELGAREIGEVQIRGRAVMSGYFNNPEATHAAFAAGGWLKTGDLGYLDERGLLYVSGRAKELIIVNGENYRPQDFEAAADAVGAVRAGRVVACGVVSEERGTEEVVLFAEVRPSSELEPAEIRRRLIESSVEKVGRRPDHVVLLEPGALPKTTSGKLRRAAVRASFEAGLQLTASRRRLTEPLSQGLRTLVELAQAHVTSILGWR